MHVHTTTMSSPFSSADARTRDVRGNAYPHIRTRVQRGITYPWQTHYTYRWSPVNDCRKYGPTRVRRILRSSHTTPSAPSRMSFSTYASYVDRIWQWELISAGSFFPYISREYFTNRLIYFSFRAMNCNGKINNITNNNEDVLSRVNFL